MIIITLNARTSMYLAQSMKRLCSVSVDFSKINISPLAALTLTSCFGDRLGRKLRRVSGVISSRGRDTPSQICALNVLAITISPGMTLEENWPSVPTKAACHWMPGKVALWPVP